MIGRRSRRNSSRDLSQWQAAFRARWRKVQPEQQPADNWKGNRRAADGGEFFKGLIDEVEIYDVALRDYQLEGQNSLDIVRGSRAITTNGEWGGYEGFPSVCRTADGRLLVSFFAARGHMDWPDPELPNMSRICVICSEDLGKTWSEPITIIDTDVGERDPSLAVLKDGTVICSYFQTVCYERGRVCEVRTIRSFDGGLTWEKRSAAVPSPWYSEEDRVEVIRQTGPQETSASHEDPVKEKFSAINATTVPPIELKNGDLLLPIYGHRTGKPYRCGFAR
ncbi:MAG: sialidase family protein [Verrucomicrobiota bacterium]